MWEYIFVGLLVFIVVILIALQVYYKIFHSNSIESNPEPQLVLAKDGNTKTSTIRTPNTPRTRPNNNVKFVTNNIVAYHLDYDNWQQITSTPDNIIYRKLVIDQSDQMWLHDINGGLWSNRTGQWTLKLTNTRGFGLKNKSYQLMDIEYYNNQLLLLYSTPEHSLICSLDGTLYQSLTCLDQEMFIVALHPCDDGWLVTARVEGRTKLWWKPISSDKFSEPLTDVVPDNHCQLTKSNKSHYISYFEYQGQNQLSPVAVNLLNIEEQKETINITKFTANTRVHDSILLDNRLIVLYTENMKLKLVLWLINSDLTIYDMKELPIGQCTADSRLAFYRNSLMVVNNKL